MEKLGISIWNCWIEFKISYLRFEFRILIRKKKSVQNFN